MTTCGVCDSDISQKDLQFLCENSHIVCVVCFSNYAVSELIKGKNIENLLCISESECKSVYVIDKDLPITKIIKNNNNLNSEKENVVNENFIECSCGIIIQKLEGPECNHLTCTCQRHYCWICKKRFGSSSEVYDHFNNTSCLQYNSQTTNTNETTIIIDMPVCETEIPPNKLCNGIFWMMFMFIMFFLFIWVITFTISVIVWLVFIGKSENNMNTLIVLFSIPSIISFIISCCACVNV